VVERVPVGQDRHGTRRLAEREAGRTGAAARPDRARRERNYAVGRSRTDQRSAEMKTPKEYLARIGAKGGKKSRRKLTKEEASRIAKLRWANKEAAREFREGMGR